MLIQLIGRQVAIHQDIRFANKGYELINQRVIHVQ
jgi:hypothetical protein